MELFKQLGLSERTLAALAQKGFTTPTPIQAQAIPILLEGKFDVIGQAQTGTGKTAAFGLPILERLQEGARHVQALILTPTRELALQVSQELLSMKGDRNLRVLAVYGGAPMSGQLRDLRRGVDVVVGTPGRVTDMIDRGELRVENLSYFVLDEADEMLNMGFAEDIEAIFKKTNTEKSVLLFSATMPERIQTLAKSYMREYQVLRTERQNLITELTEQSYYEVYDRDKIEVLCRILDKEVAFYGFVFCNTKADVDDLTARLNDRGYRAEALHGDIAQAQREKILNKFKKRQATVLLATDVAARGIDVKDLTHVINYSLPNDPESYVHRIGRTGRAGKKGLAISLISPIEARKLVLIKRVAKAEIKREQIPSIKDVIQAKRLKFHTIVTDGIVAENYNEAYINIAKGIMENADPTLAMATLLQYTFGDVMNRENYTEIKEIQPRAERPGDSRFAERSPRNDRNDRPAYGRDRNSDRTSDRNDRPAYGRDRNDRNNDRPAYGDRPASGDRPSYGDRNNSDRGANRERRETSYSPSAGGESVSLFMAMGRSAKATPRMVAEFIEMHSGVHGRNVQDIRIFERHTTISVAPGDVDTIINTFRDKKFGEQPLVRRDRERKF